MTFNAANTQEQVLRQIDIHELLPQQEPFVMVDTLVRINERATVTRTLIKESNIFVDGKCLSASGLVENIAQTCAARIGYVNKYILKKEIQLGFIGAIRNMEILRLPLVGEEIETSVAVVEEVFGMTLANAIVTCNGETIAMTEMKIAIKESGE